MVDALNPVRCAIVAIVLWLVAGTARSEVLQGRVLEVLDGDSFVLLTDDDRQVEVRVAEIDAPEGGQPYGDRSRRMLSGLIQGKSLTLRVQTTDSYGRLVGRPYVAQLDVSAEMVRAGGAWVYQRYLNDASLPPLEEAARAGRIGLWGLPEAERQPPWSWRRQHRGQSGSAGQGCVIKGNISGGGERIYHVPGQKHYQETRISPSRGERWFCSEAEAQAAGWRRARP